MRSSEDIRISRIFFHVVDEASKYFHKFSLRQSLSGENLASQGLTKCPSKPRISFPTVNCSPTSQTTASEIKRRQKRPSRNHHTWNLFSHQKRLLWHMHMSRSSNPRFQQDTCVSLKKQSGVVQVRLQSTQFNHSKPRGCVTPSSSHTCTLCSRAREKKCVKISHASISDALRYQKHPLRCKIVVTADRHKNEYKHVSKKKKKKNLGK